MERDQIKALLTYVVGEYRRTMHMDSDKQLNALTDEVIRRELITSPPAKEKADVSE